MNRLLRFLAQHRASASKPVVVPVVERDPAVAALIDRCSKITSDEDALLSAAWREVEADPEKLARVSEGERLARAARPDAVDEASHVAEWAYARTLPIPAGEMLYLGHNPIYGRTLAAIWAHAAAVAAGDSIPKDLAVAMSGPWRDAIGQGAPDGRLEWD